MRALALGNFDGVHLGHQLIIKTLLRHSRSASSQPATSSQPTSSNKPTASNQPPNTLEPEVLTFSPHPYRFFKPDAPPFTLTPDALKQKLLLALGVSKVHFYPFTAQLADLSAHKFVTEVIQRQFNARLVVVGEDFAFGKGRSGTVRDLQAEGLQIQIVKTLKHQDLTYSSSAARQALTEGMPHIAHQIMDRPFAITAPVTKGSGRGSTLGFATANLDLSQHNQILMPKFGVYAVRANGTAAVLNYGIRPTFSSDEAAVMEVHLLDAPSQVPATLQVEFYHYLRGEKKFPTTDALKAQITQDITQAKHLFQKQMPPTNTNPKKPTTAKNTPNSNTSNTAPTGANLDA